MKITSNLGKCLILAPEHQTALEKAAILKDKRLAEILNGKTVADIVKVDGGYIVTTTDGTRHKVNVIYLPSGIGPQKFKLFFEQVFVENDASAKASARRFNTENR